MQTSDLSWRQDRIIELLNAGPASSSELVQRMNDPLGEVPTASIRRDIGTLNKRGYQIQSVDGQYQLLATPVVAPAIQTSASL